MFHRVFFCLAIVACPFVSTAVADQTDASARQEVIGMPEPVLQPYYVCPRQFLEPVYVPADLLLQQADMIQPRTPEGWIVTNRPVSECCSFSADPAARAYSNFEYPLRLRQYDSQIRLARAEVLSWKRRLSVYYYFNKTGALMVTTENAKLFLLEAQERLRNLRYERMLFIRQHNLEAQLHAQGLLVSREVLSTSGALPKESAESPAGN